MELATVDALVEVFLERERQDEKWGQQDHSDGTGAGYRERANSARHACNAAARRGFLTWRHILAEEFAEALAESDPVKLREELIQVAAVAVAWVEAIDRRSS